MKDESRRRFLTCAVAASTIGITDSPVGATAKTDRSYDVIHFGANGDGKTDNTKQIQHALNSAGKDGGGIVTMPSGQFLIRGTLSIPAGVTLQGCFRVPPCARHDHQPNLHGTVLLAYSGRGEPKSAPFIHLAGNMSALQGVIITYPEWKQTDVPPIPYPPTILADGNTENVAVVDCCLLNTYEAITLLSASRHYIRNVYGYPHWRGLYIDNCTDIGRVENCHFWPFGVNYQPNDPFCEWVNTHAVAFEFARTDWQYVINTFCFGYGAGYKFSQSAAGACNGNFLGIGSDSCERDILVEQAQPYGLLITNGEFVGRWTSKDAICVEIKEGVTSKISLTNCSFWGPIARVIVQRSEKAQFTANACHFVDWTEHAIEIQAGKAIVQGCTFMQNKTAVVVGQNASSVLISTNQAEGGLKVENHAGAVTQMGLNEI